jgi:hypothetical protein
MVNVQMTLQCLTLERVHELKLHMGVENETDVVARCVRLAHMIAKEISKGGRVEIRRDGLVSEITLK